MPQQGKGMGNPSFNSIAFEVSRIIVKSIDTVAKLSPFGHRVTFEALSSIGI